jgi:hypothetical protein
MASPKRSGRPVHKEIARERAACADIVRSAGCICFDLEAESCAATLRRSGLTGNDLEVVTHDPRCPKALALSIEAHRP